ncbi:hypothetical protein Tco_1068694 [Tanacetum coccineum]|uniref:Uncharacterized protein n=1 Tax=Tanacetum coccineum TaxID=301880 RepID=A0ABQ5HIC7_9ASTR
MGCMIRAKLEDSTARLKKLVLLAKVSTASRVSIASRITSNRTHYSTGDPIGGGVTDLESEPDPVMSSSSTVTYTSVYTDSDREIMLGADGDSLMEVLHEYLRTLSLERPEYLVPADAEAPLEDQPLPVDASPTALSPGFMADSDPDEDPKEDPEEDHADYPR